MPRSERRSREPRLARLALPILAAAALVAAGGADLSGSEPPTAPEVAPTARLADDAGWATILARYVTEDLRFDYPGLAGRAEDREVLAGWLASQARVDVAALPRPAQKAFWINLYNAATVELILRHHPVESILKLGIVPGRAWKWEFVRADGRLLSLDHIEHEILRADFADPRIHFAINCASLSCPPLRREPYRAAQLDEQLDAATRDYLATPAGMSLSAGRDGRLVVTVSKIFDWFREDFESEQGGLAGFLERHAPPDEAALLGRSRDRIDVRFAEYDWSLNAPGG